MSAGSDRNQDRRSQLHYPAVDLRIDARRLILITILGAVAFELFLLFFDYQFNYGNNDGIDAVRRLANLAREDSLSSWFGTTQTFLIALTLWAIFLAVRGETSSKFRRRGWMVIAAFFTYMSLDDGAKVHERLGTTFKYAVKPEEGAGAGIGQAILDFFPSYTWQVVFLPMFGSMALFILYFMWKELRDRRALVIVAAALGCFVFAVSLDFIEGLEPDHPLNLYNVIVEQFDFRDFAEYRFDSSPLNTVRHFSKSIEEATEMFGNTLLWWVFLRHLTGIAGVLRVRFSSLVG